MTLWERFKDRYPIVAAHRGASRFAPENTMSAFAKALGLGAKAIELDVQMTLDHQIVVIHDSTLNRTTSGEGLVRDKTLTELRGLDAGSWFAADFAGELIPTLDEVLSMLKGRAFVNIELKPGHLDDVGFESRVVDTVRSHQMEHEVLLMSFDHVSIGRAKQHTNDIAALVVSGARLANEVDYLRAINADGSNHSPLWWTSEAVSRFHHEGLIAHASLINNSEAWAQALLHGVDMVDSDNPLIYGTAVEPRV